MLKSFFACARFLVSFLWVWVLLALGSQRAQTANAADPAFNTVGVAFVQKHCVMCHGEQNKKADLSLSADKDDFSVFKNRKRWDLAIEMIEAGEMPPAKQPRPTPAEIEQFTASVQAAFANGNKAAKLDPGRVTIRRLNRTEYNNTIRDLVGVDFQPAEDFPSDDIGHGFDNIGDVLTVSPVLMERYLAAAESIANRAIMPNPPKPTKYTLASKYCEPGGKDVIKGPAFRRLSPTKDATPQESGPVAAKVRYSVESEYILRTKVYGKPIKGQPLRVALLITGKDVEPSPTEELDQIVGAARKTMLPARILKVVEVQAREQKKAEMLEVPFGKIPGVEKISLAILKNDNEERDEQPELFFEYLQLEGPLDPRPSSHYRILACSADKSQPEQTREVLTRFASRAYRRPATEQEVSRLVELVDEAMAGGADWQTGIQFAMQAVLVSPKFLFRVELDNRPQGDAPRPLDEFQLAARLSYFLWGSMPDLELFTLAHQGKLTANLESQVRRMLLDPKATSLVDNFAMQWLQLQRLQTFTPDSKAFPSFNEPLRQAMMTETRLFIGEVIRDNRSILDLIDGNFTYMNETLAKHYGVIDTVGTRYGQKPTKKGDQIKGKDWFRVELADVQRGGLLTQASILTVTSNPTRTSPVKRGRWVLEQILGTPPPPPPPNVPELEEGKQLVGTLRERMEQHRANPSCASCHARMDPIGFAFENFDAIGKFRDKDGDHAIDASGTLPDGKSFQGPAEFKTILKEKKELFARSLTEKMLTYALGRGLEYYDQPAIDRIVAGLDRDNYQFSTLMTEIAKSDPFRLRRGKDTTP